jgi:ABC-2 type transport system permease protein
VLYNYAQRLGLGLNQALVFLLPGYLISALAVGPWLPSSLWQVLALLAALVLSISIQFCLHAAIALIAFWFEENSAFIWIFSKIALVAGTLMPIEFLPASWQTVLWWTPFPWISWAPARLAVLPGGGADIAAILGGQLAWLIASALIASAVFRLAIRRTTVQGG